MLPCVLQHGHSIVQWHYTMTVRVVHGHRDRLAVYTCHRHWDEGYAHINTPTHQHINTSTHLISAKQRNPNSWRTQTRGNVTFSIDEQPLLPWLHTPIVHQDDVR